jgi:hypothetical protein
MLVPLNVDFIDKLFILNFVKEQSIVVCNLIIAS